MSSLFDSILMLSNKPSGNLGETVLVEGFNFGNATDAASPQFRQPIESFPPKSINR